ncbi:MAG: hypothetical protein R6V05_03170 [Candidatus Brocadiia bacterium]
MREELTEGQKRVVDVLLSLQSHAFSSIENRQAMEWRLSISLWTAAAILLGFLIKGDVQEISVWVKLSVTALAVAVVALHMLWAKGAGRRTGSDVRVCYFWERQTRKQLDAEYPPEMEAEMGKLRSTAGQLKAYSLFFQISTTALLAFTIIAVVWSVC